MTISEVWEEGCGIRIENYCLEDNFSQLGPSFHTSVHFNCLVDLVELKFLDLLDEKINLITK